MAYTSYKQFAPNGYEFIDDKTGQSVVASGPEAILHARKIDSIYAPVDPIMRAAADAELLAQVDKSGGLGSRYISPEEKAALPPKYGTPVMSDVPAPVEVGPPPASIALPTGIPFQGLMINKRSQHSEVANAIEDKKRAVAGIPAPVEESDIPYKAAPQRFQNKTSNLPSDNWDMEKKGSHFLSEPTTPEAIAEKAYIANEVAAAASPPLPGPVEQLGPSVPVSRSGIMGPSPVALDEWMKADQALALQQAEAESKGLDRQAIIDQRLSNIADVAEKSSAKQIELLQQEESSRAETRAILDDLRKEFNASINPRNAFNKPSFGDKVEAGLFSFIGGLGSAFLGVSPDKIVEDMRKSINKDAQRRGEISKRIEEAYKNSDMLSAMADKDKAIIATQGALQTQAILSRIDALKAANLTEAQRDRLALVRPSVEAMHAKFLMDLDTQRNGTVNYALAGGMKPKGGGGGSNTKALEEYRKEMGSRLSRRIKIGGKTIEMPVEMDKGDFSDIAREAHATNIIQNRINDLIKEANEAGFSERIGSTPAGDIMANRIMSLKQLINKKIGGGEMSDSQSKLIKGSLFTQGPATIFREMARDMDNDSATLQDRARTGGGVEVK